MRISTGFIFILSAILISCQTNPKVDLPSLVGSQTTPLESIIDNWDQTMADIDRRDIAGQVNWQEELFRVCIKQENLCEYSSKNPKKRELTKKKLADIKKEIAMENFEALSILSIESSLRFFERYKKKDLMNFADNLLHDSTCRTQDMKHALATELEDYLPEYEVKTATLALYEMNVQCTMSRTTAMSAYRAAMLRLLDKDCGKALPSLEKVTASAEDYLKPRSLYWSWRCEGQSPAIKAAAIIQLPYFSYHRILMEKSTILRMEENGPLNEQTPVNVETKKNPNLNLAARLAEKLMARQNSFAARAVLERIRVERIQESEPEFQVYWAHLLHINQSGIRKFQILSNIVNNFPQYRSKTVKNMLFPTWYFDHVEAHSKKLDPWLVQALIRQESAFDPRAKSRVGASGLMQLMPGTAKKFQRSKGHISDPTYNVQSGVNFLEKLVKRFDGQVHLALAGYNAGPARVDQWMKRYQTDDVMLFVDAIPYRETREYVAFILRNYYWYRSLNTKDLPQAINPQDDPFGRVAIQPE